jgi:Tol biopolymer transport system component
VAQDTGLWSLDSTRAGTISGEGVFTANGLGSGEIEVRCEIPDLRGGVLRATTKLTVRATREILGDGVPMDIARRFATGTRMSNPAMASRVLYPLHQALMPENVAPPKIQWERGDEGDVYRVRLSKPNYTVTAYVRHTGAMFDFAWLVDATAWRALAEADPGAPVILTVDRYVPASTEVYTSSPIELRFARGSIYGSVYYWDLDAGRMMRINARTATSENFMPNPPDRSNGQRCVACHTVSRDGRWMAAATTSRLSMDGFRNTVFDLTADLSPTPAPTISTASNAHCSTFNPDGTRLLACGASWSSALSLLDPRTGMSVAANGLPTIRATMPEWSPDGRTIAFIDNVTLNRDGNPIGGDLRTLTIADPLAEPLSFGAARTLHAGADATPGLPRGNSNAWPTWSPNSEWIVFQHGQAAFSFDGQAALYAIARSGGSPVRLDRANDGPNGTGSYRPTFSPFTTMEPDGRRLFWLAFYSTRDYGNAQAGTRGTGRRQIWVAAINANPTEGSDPSYVAYWLPGQNVRDHNVAGYWAAEACRMNGNECRTNSECCSGRCNAMGRCEPPPAMECRRRGQSCGTDGDCCMGLRCFGNVCEMPLG